MTSDGGPSVDPASLEGAACPFCDLASRPLVAQNALAALPTEGRVPRDQDGPERPAFRDGFPVNPGHTLIVPRRHVATWRWPGRVSAAQPRTGGSGFDATREEQVSILELADEVKATLDAELRPDGYNGGFNAGEAAGQTVPHHLHLHLIPRFDGDVDNPTGGVRFVIPARGNYRNPGFVPQPAVVPEGERLAHGASKGRA